MNDRVTGGPGGFRPFGAGFADTVDRRGHANLGSHAEATKTYATEAEAKAAYTAKSVHLANIGHWSQISGFENAAFAHFGPTGKPVDPPRAARRGDFVRIDLPGATLLGKYWVTVEEVAFEPDATQVVVRPTYDPTEVPVNKTVTAHFFTKEATNTLRLERQGQVLVASVIGRNENTNDGREAGGIVAQAKNTIVSQSAWGARFPIPGTRSQINGLQQQQWNRFTRLLLDE